MRKGIFLGVMLTLFLMVVTPCVSTASIEKIDQDDSNDKIDLRVHVVNNETSEPIQGAIIIVLRSGLINFPAHLSRIYIADEDGFTPWMTLYPTIIPTMFPFIVVTYKSGMGLSVEFIYLQPGDSLTLEQRI